MHRSTASYQRRAALDPGFYANLYQKQLAYQKRYNRARKHARRMARLQGISFAQAWAKPVIRSILNGEQ